MPRHSTPHTELCLDKNFHDPTIRRANYQMSNRSLILSAICSILAIAVRTAVLAQNLHGAIYHLDNSEQDGTRPPNRWLKALMTQGVQAQDAEKSTRKFTSAFWRNFCGLRSDTIKISRKFSQVFLRKSLETRTARARGSGGSPTATGTDCSRNRKNQRLIKINGLAILDTDSR